MPRIPTLEERLGITLIPLENFRVAQTKFSTAPKVFSIYLDGFFIRKLPCECSSRMLLDSGCQCGGV